MRQDTLRLDNLTVRNFRCFEECTIALHPNLTVLVAENGVGKTAVLDAIGIALGLFVDTLAGTHQSHGFEPSDVRKAPDADGVMNPALPTGFEAEGAVDGKSIHWSRTVKRASKGARTTTKDAKRLRKGALDIRERLKRFAADANEVEPLLPAMCFYGTGRLWSELRLRQRWATAEMSKMGRVAGYLDCISSSSSFVAFVDWYARTFESASGSLSRGLSSGEQPAKLIAAVEKATKIVLEPTGWHNLEWDRTRKTLTVQHANHGRLPLSDLSDGVRNMIALVADLAHRCVRLNPHFGETAAESTPGILLIDEVDMHLHPGWQQRVVELLAKAFPRMQMVVSTHSPHVLSAVDVESIRVIRLRNGKGELETPKFQTRGVESADVLAAIMHVDPVPQVKEARQLSQYRALIEDGKADTVDALGLRALLSDHFGDTHPVMIDCDRLIRFQSFKLRRNRPEGG